MHSAVAINYARSIAHLAWGWPSPPPKRQLRPWQRLCGGGRRRARGMSTPPRVGEGVGERAASYY